MVPALSIQYLLNDGEKKNDAEVAGKRFAWEERKIKIHNQNELNVSASEYELLTSLKIKCAMYAGEIHALSSKLAFTVENIFFSKDIRSTL